MRHERLLQLARDLDGRYWIKGTLRAIPTILLYNAVFSLGFYALWKWAL